MAEISGLDAYLQHRKDIVLWGRAAGSFLTITNYLLTHPDKQDLIHMLLSSMCFATGLYHGVDIRTQGLYWMSYRDSEPSKDIEMQYDGRYFTTVQIMNITRWILIHCKLSVCFFVFSFSYISNNGTLCWVNWNKRKLLSKPVSTV